jgi:hypothetical protein
MRINMADYPPPVEELLRIMPLAPLGPGTPHREAQDKLEAIGPAFAPGADRNMVAACQAGLWLAFDFLDEAHTISQELHIVEGSYWHALMHRREPDFANSKYWFQRVGDHPVYERLREEAVKLASGRMWPTFLGQAEWDAAAFVDLCEAHYEAGAPGHEFCRRLQRAEWELLFDWCYRRAGG